jgi:hypothetical protein
MTHNSENTAAAQDGLSDDYFKKLCIDYYADLDDVRETYLDKVAEQVAAWFFDNFADPTYLSLPYDSEEDGYIGDVRDTREQVADVLNEN